MSDKNPILYDMLGGEAAIDATVSLFYAKLQEDPLLAPFFAHIDINHQMFKQKEFLTYAFGGSARYEGASLREAHRAAVQQGLAAEHFQRTAEILAETLQDLGIREDLIDCVLEIVASTRADVLNL